MRKQAGFTLIEIAIVLVIVGLLLGGVLKGQELITSARVRNLAQMQDGFKAAFFGFQDRFRALPGDYTGALAKANISGVVDQGTCTGAVNGGGNGDGQIQVGESIIAWEHMSKAGFITGSYTCAAAANATTNTPQNIYNSYVQIVYDGIYGMVSNGTQRHNIKTGPSIPVAIIAELDRKIDDGLPYTGSFQFSLWAGGGTAPTEPASCVTVATAAGVWNAITSVTNCGGASSL